MQQGFGTSGKGPMKKAHRQGGQNCVRSNSQLQHGTK